MVAPIIAGIAIGGARVVAAAGGALARGGAALASRAIPAIGRGAAATGRGLLNAGRYGLERALTRNTQQGPIDTEQMLQEWLEDLLIEEVNKRAKQIYQDAIQNTPKGKSGKLKAGWRLKMIQSVAENAEVWNIQDYAAYVEYDTKDRRGRYMLTNAISRAML